MINNIHMKSCATYNKSGASLMNCKKINFIYGANGSGKSTISNFLLQQENPCFSSSSIDWYGSTHEEIKVYNREFRKRNFQASDIPGVFTLGEATIDDIKKLEKNKKERENKYEDYNKKCSSIRKKEEEREKRIAKFKNDIWEQILKKYSSDFQTAFEGFRNSKDRFYAELLRRQSGKKTESTQSAEQLKDRAKTLYSKQLEKCSVIFFDMGRAKKSIDNICASDIWQKVIIGNEDVEIGKLIKFLNNSDWINQGIKFIQLDSDICPFCQQHTITSDFRTQLGSFFDKEYKTKIEQLNQYLDAYTKYSDEIIRTFEAVLNNQQNITIGKIDETVYKAKLQLLSQLFSDNKSIIREKQKEPGRKFALKESDKLIEEIENFVLAANEEIEKHNALVNNSKDEKIKLTDDIWAYCISEQSVLIDSYNKDIKGIDNAIVSISNIKNQIKKELENLDLLIVEEGKNITSVQPTVDEINRLLKAYGFCNFHIAPSTEQENSYQIQREDGTLATNTLSEGEETFISFLYFMQLTKGAIDVSQVSAKKIIVLDDPISSLDSTILYIVSAMVKELTMKVRKGETDVEQVFVFTHNVFFHKEASYIDGRTSKLNDVNYWIIRKDKGVSSIDSYGMDNPISTSYELLWRELSDDKNPSLISVQNTMRRIIENYFGMLGGKKDDYIENKFETVEEQLICKSLFYWINDGSHSIPDDFFIDSYTDSVQKYKEIFHQIFIRTNHEAHYNMMMGIEDDKEAIIEPDV